jgi:hypothetical protein
MPKNPNIILFALVAFLIFCVFFRNGNTSSFGAVATKTIIVPNSLTSYSIPVKDANGTSLTSLTVTIPTGTTNLPVSINTYSNGVLSYSVNAVAQPSVNVYSSKSTDANFIAKGFYTAGSNKTSCIKATDLAQRGIANATDFANSACIAAGFSNGADPISANTAACTATGGGSQYTCKPNVFPVTLSVPNFVAGTTISYALLNSDGIVTSSLSASNPVLPPPPPLNASTIINGFNPGGYMLVKITVPGQTPSDIYYGNNYTGKAVTIPAANNNIVSGSIITLPSTTITVTNNISTQITV